VTSNPFATRFIAPGALAFLFPAGESAESVVQRLKKNGWWGQIIGPHGSGKSTLIATLGPALAAAGREVILLAVRGGQPPPPLPAHDQIGSHTQIIVDGYEQLGFWRRLRLKWLARRAGAGLLVTAHVGVGLPALYETKAELKVVQEVVARLTAGSDIPLAPEDVSSALAAAKGNVREALFQLYDTFEQRRSQAERQMG